jgi:uncharacterized membrane protein
VPQPKKSLNDEIELSLFNERGHLALRQELMGALAAYSMVGMVVLILIVYQWAQWQFGWRPHPIWFAFFGFGLVFYVMLRVGMILPRLKLLVRQEQSRAHMQAAMDRLKRTGWYYFDSVPDQLGRDLGGVLVGSGGVFSLTGRHVTTQGRMFEAADHLDDTTLNFAGRPAVGDPLGQAKKAAFALYKLLGDAGVDTVAVQPVLLLVGWNLGTRPKGEQRSVWVENEVTLEQNLSKLPRSVDPKQVMQICEILAPRRSHS